MAKGLGLIGNFRGKFGNAVGYNLKDSNNKQTQGIRIYQPIVKNPKTYAQAEQRARLAPINATYRLLKSVIDRGQEGIAYGNKSRLAWLKAAMKSFNGGWFVKEAPISFPAIVPISKGSLGVDIQPNMDEGNFYTRISVDEGKPGNTVGSLSTAAISKFPSLQVGDQLTFVAVANEGNGMVAQVVSVVLDTASTDALPTSIATQGTGWSLSGFEGSYVAGCIIVSREGDGGQHLRSSTTLKYRSDTAIAELLPAAKDAAIRSYMAAGTTTDWPQEPIKD